MRRVVAGGIEVRIEDGFSPGRSAEFLRRPARHQAAHKLWHRALQSVASAAGIDRQFSAGFILDDGRTAMTAEGDGGAVVCINPERFAEATLKYGHEPLSLAAYLHGVACHELAHLDGRMGNGHDEEFIAAREDLGAATAHTIPKIAEMAACALGLGSCTTRPTQYETARLEAVRACEGDACLPPPARHLLPSAKDPSMLRLVTIYSPPGANAIGSTQVLPLATDVSVGTVHFSDGLDGLAAGKYVVQRGQHDLTDTPVWVFHPSTTAFVYVGALLLRKASAEEAAELAASKRSWIRVARGGVSLRISDDPVAPEAAAWMPTAKLTTDEESTLGASKRSAIERAARKQAKADMKAGTNPMLSTPSPRFSDAENVARLEAWQSLRDDYENEKTGGLADIVEYSEDDKAGYIMHAAMKAWDHFYDDESTKLLARC